MILATSESLQHASWTMAFFLLSGSHRGKKRYRLWLLASLPTDCCSYRGSPQADLATLFLLSILLWFALFLFPDLGSVLPLAWLFLESHNSRIWVEPAAAIYWNIPLLMVDHISKLCDIHPAPSFLESFTVGT